MPKKYGYAKFGVKISVSVVYEYAHGYLEFLGTGYGYAIYRIFGTLSIA